MSSSWDDRKKALEEDYFRRKEQEALEKLRAAHAAEQQTAGEMSAAATATLQCPKCDGTLTEETFEEVQIDRCSKCNGVWLDAGELERLTQREEAGGGGFFGRLWKSSNQ